MGERYRALVYIRKSLVRHRRDERSPERQLENCLAAVDAHGWTIEETDIYRDAEGHRSGRSEKHRPAWRALKERVLTDPTIVAVVVDSLDRMSRSPKDFFIFLDLVQEHGVELVSVKEQFDTSTAIGRAFLAILMVIASLESDLASERMMATVDYMRRQGIHWGRTPFGYTRDENAIPQPDENAPVAVKTLKIYASGLYSCADLVDKLNKEGHRWRLGPERPSVPFMLSSVRSVVNSVLVYAGWVPTVGYKEIRAAGPPDNLEEAILIAAAVPGQHEALIDEDLANRVLAARRIRTVKSAHSNDYTFLLTPMLECANCGKKMVGKRDLTWRGVPRYYHRGKSCSYGRGSCDSDPLEAQVLALLDFPLVPEIIEDIKAATAEQAAARPEGEFLKRQLASRRAEMERMRELYVLGDYTQAEYITRRSVALADIEELEEQLGQPDYPLETTVARIEQLGAILRSGNRRLQRRALPNIFTRIAVDLDGQITKVELKEWVGPLLRDLAHLEDHDLKCAKEVSCAQNIVVLAGIDKDATTTGGTPLPPLTQAPDTAYPTRPG